MVFSFSCVILRLTAFFNCRHMYLASTNGIKINFKPILKKAEVGSFWFFKTIFFFCLSIFLSSRVLLSPSLVSGGCQRPAVKDGIDCPLTLTSKQTNKQHKHNSVKSESLPCSRCGNQKKTQQQQ